MNAETHKEENVALLRLARLLRPHLSRLSIALVMLIGLTAVNIAVPLMIGMVFNRVFPHGNWALLWIILAGLLGLFVVRNVLYFVSKYAAVQVGEDVCFDLRNNLFERLQQMNLQYYRDNQPGKLSSKVMNDSFVIQQFIQNELPTLLSAALLFLGLVAVMYAMNWQLALAATIVLPLHIATFYYFKGPIKAASRTAQEHLANASGNLIEKFLGVEVVKGFTGEARENQTFQEAIDLSRQSQLVSQRYHVTQKVMADLLIGVGMIALFGFGAYQVMGRPQGRAMQIGDFMAFFFYVKMLYPTVADLMSGFAKFTKTTAGVDRVCDVLEARGSEQETGQRLRPAIAGTIQFQNVSFRYSQSPLVLKNISFTMQSGEVCAIVGPSGSGKSTLVSLVPRFNEPELGSVMIDGINVRDIELHHLRQTIGIAFQECFLFSSTIVENLRYAKPHAKRSEIIEVAKRTGAHDFITRLPHGYNTLVGDQGVSLSRGQKQLITLTRAMLKNPQILILDEATASIDAARETQVIAAIREFMKGKTTLMITHRPELLKHADRVLQIVDGRVVHFGSPQDMKPANLSDASFPGMPLDMDPPADADAPENERHASGSWPGVGVSMLALAFCLASLFGAATVAAQDDPAAAPADAPVAETAEPAPAPEPALADGQAGRFTALPGLTGIEISELIDVAVVQAQAKFGYRHAAPEQAATLLPTPDELRHVRTLSRVASDGLHLLQIGFRSFLSQPPHLWIYGRTVRDGAVAPNPDAADLQEVFVQLHQAASEEAAQLTVRDLRAQIIKLSYAETGRAVGVLRSLGFQVIEYTANGSSAGKMEMIAATSEVDPARLPAIIAMPDPKSVDLVGGRESRAGAFQLQMTPSVASDLTNLTTASPLMELLVLYDPARPEQFAEVLHRVRTAIDRPAEQIVIEAMILEISETGLLKLGVNWELTTPFANHHNADNINDLRVGRLPNFSSRTDEQATLDIVANDVFGHFRAQLQALVRTGDAKILSRPSVLTLDGRQASIRVGEEIPVATSFQGVRAGDLVKLDFAYIPIGILLNVRPRIATNAEEISMQIDGMVSSQVPGEDLVVRDQNGDELGRAPRISTRRVQTYARVANNTPFIIGGLISEDRVQEVDKVPLLGDIPIIKHAFRSTRVENLKREVIIVLTPYVLPEDQLVGRSLPKDEDAFDSFGHQLFRDAYRIRAEDVFDLSFLTDNQQLRRMQAITEQVIRHNHDLASVYPFSEFANGRIPGEHILVFRQMYEVINRKKLDEQLDAAHLIFFEKDEQTQSGFRVRFLKNFLEAQASDAPSQPGGQTNLFAGLNNKAVAITYTEQADPSEVAAILRQPVPDVQLLDIPDRRTWSRLLWEMNQPDEQGRQRRTILLQNERDLTRLRRAVLLKQTVELNATEGSLTLNNFTIGRLLLMPSVKDEKIYVLDSDVAKYFFFTEQYYPALQQRLHLDSKALQEAIEHPDYARYLDNP